MADPGDKGAGDKKIKMPWGMKIGGLKPGAKETITDKKLKTFVVGKQKKSRLQKVGGNVLMIVAAAAAAQSSAETSHSSSSSRLACVCFVGLSSPRLLGPGVSS